MLLLRDPLRHPLHARAMQTSAEKVIMRFIPILR